MLKRISDPAKHLRRKVLRKYQLFDDGGLYHIETSPLICRANQWTGFYMIGTSSIRELKGFLSLTISRKFGRVLNTLLGEQMEWFM